MSSEMQHLTAVLDQRREQLWRLQNVALRLTVEGPSPEPCRLLALGLTELAAALREVAPPALTGTLEAVARTLSGAGVAPGEVARASELLEALVSVLNGGDEVGLSKLIDDEGGLSRGDGPAAGASAGQHLLDRPEGVDAEDLRLFAAEAREHIERIEVTLVELESSRDLKLIGEIFRGAHSIKGAAQYLGLEATAALAHRAETLLDRLRSQRLALAPRVISILLRSFDALSTLIEALEKGERAPVNVRALVEELDGVIDGEGEAPPMDASDASIVEKAADLGSGPAVAPAAVETPAATLSAGDGGDEQDDTELFAAEYRENVRSARDLLSDLSAIAGMPEKIAIASRNLHSLKGLAGLVGIVEMERIAGTLDVLVSKVVRSHEVAPDVQRAVGSALDLLEEVFRRHRQGERAPSSIDEQISALEALALREGQQAAVGGVDPWQGVAVDSGTGPLAERFAELVEGLRRGDEMAVAAALAELAKAARLQGCDEAGEAAETLGGEWRRLDRGTLRERLLGLRNLLPNDLLSWRAPTPAAAGGSFEDAVRTVPGIGPKKLRRLKEAGVSSRDAVRALGLHGLIAIPGISIEQAKMLLTNCGGSASVKVAPARSEGPASLEQQVLDDDYDRQLVGIYLDTTIRQIDAVRTRLREGAVGAASELLDDLMGAARYMGYSALLDSFGEVRGQVDGEAGAREACSTLLSTVRVRIERLRARLARLQEGISAVPTDAEVKELERIFVESAEAHLRNIGRDLQLFLARPDEALLAALQHHLSCVHSAATNIGRDGMAVEAEGLQSRIEDIWLNPRSQDAHAGGAAVAALARLFAGCGLTAPAIEIPAVPSTVAESPSTDASVPREAVVRADAMDVAGGAETVGAPSLAPVDVTAGEPEAEALSGAVTGTPQSVPEADASSVTAATTGAGATEGEPSGPEGGETARALVDAQATVRVDTAKIDDLLNMVAELVVNRSAFMVLGTNLNELANRLIDSGQLGTTDARDLRTVLTRYDEAMTEQGRVSNQLQQGVMLIRMMPVHTLFSRVPRLVRDLAMRESRRVKVVFSGEDTELDKTVIERLSDPLVHLIRNAISHGIESPEERLAAGKPAEGRLLISARHQGNIVIIEVEDDGRGVDFERIRRRWVESGLGSAAQVSRLSSRELLSALFLPGFSTADKVTDVSGRGVGLDIVKRNIENLGGQVEAVTEPGRLSRFTIRIPLTMAIMQALLVRVASEIYAIPGSAVVQAERITRDQIYSVENQKVITLRRSVIPLVDLEEVFAYNYYVETGQTVDAGALGRGQGGISDDGVHVVVLQGEGREIGIVVNGLIGSQDIVIKSLEDDLVDGRGIAGASILGDGTVALILDVGEICKMVMDGQHSDELRRTETMRQFERYLQERGRQGMEPAIPDQHVH
jgi:chemotaxis protein histidine kinase CheA